MFKLMPKNPVILMQRLWHFLQPWPGGAWLFSRLIGRINRYSGSIGANVIALRPGYAKLELPDKSKIRNHLNSIHALALANFGEYASALAMLTGLPENVRAIPIAISVRYVKKARGKLFTESHCKIPEVKTDMDFDVSADICNQAGEPIANVKVTWRLGLIENRSSGG